MSENITQDNLLEALEAEEYDRARAYLNEMHPSEIADLLESQPAKIREKIWDMVPSELDGDVLSHAQDAVRAGLLETMAPQEVADATRELDVDDAADILNDLPEDVMDSVLLSMDVQNRERLASVLSYPEDTAGGLMNLDVVPVRADVSLDVVTRYLRKLGELPDQTDSLMVVDRENHYLGILPLSNILTHNQEASVGELMVPGVNMTADTPAREVAKIFEQRDLLSAAVIDNHGLLLGRITVDDVVDVIQQEAEHTMRSMARLGDDDMFAPVFTSTKRRAVWLGVNLVTAFLAAWVIGHFKDTIQQLVALAVLMPIVASMGGIAGSQTLTIATRGIALGQLGKANARSLLVKELSVGILNGVVWASLIGFIAGLWFNDAPLGLVIGSAVIINLMVAACAGATIPLILKRLGIDPAIAGGVLLMTLTDVVGFMTFLGLATIFLVN